MIIYTRATCAPCRQIKDFLDRHKATYTVKDVGDPQNEKEWLQYAMTVPVVVKGDQVVIGPDLGRIKQLLV